MAVSLKHAFNSGKGDPTDATIVRPSNWNAEHALTLGQDALLGRDSSGGGAAQEIPCLSFGRAILNAASYAAMNTLLGLGALALKSTAVITDISGVNTARLLGRTTAAAGVVEEISVGTGLALSAGVLSASSFGVRGACANKSIKVSSTTTVAVSVDAVTMSDGTNFLTKAVSGTVNLGTNGGVLALDAGAIAIDTWYALYAAAKPDGTVTILASTSFTTPALASGYTMFAYLSAVQTIHGAATLYGTWQFGRKAQYIYGLLGTTAFPSTTPGSTSGVWTAGAVTRLVPPTASHIHVYGMKSGGTGDGYIAPNNSYAFGGAGASGEAPMSTPTNSMVFQGWFLLESGNIYSSVSNGGGTTTPCAMGWEDNG